MRHLSFRPGLTLRGREARGIRGFAGKPFHPPLTDVPLGAYTIAAVFDVVAAFAVAEIWAQNLSRAAGLVMFAGAAVSILTVLTGYLDWRDTSAGTQMRRMTNAHAWTMVTMTVLVLVSLATRFVVLTHGRPHWVLAVLGVAIGTIAIVGGTLGGALVYDYGFNVETSTDHPVWHPSPVDILHPKEASMQQASAERNDDARSG